jgi:hypothetical protein
MSKTVEMRLLGVLTSRRRPKILYHYTSGSGLIGILQSKSIWATSIRFLNDSNEAVTDEADENKRAGTDQDRVLRETFKRVGRLLRLVAPALKDPSFAEEREWRLIRLADSFEQDDLHFRQGRSMLIPYHKHSFEPNGVPVGELVIGPTPHPELARDAAQALLLAAGRTSATSRVSSIPYRAW